MPHLTSREDLHAYVTLYCFARYREPRSRRHLPPPRPIRSSAAPRSATWQPTATPTARTVNASLKVTWDLDGPWKHNWTALAITARTDDVKTAESYAAGYKAQRDFSETSYMFFSGDWREDSSPATTGRSPKPSATAAGSSKRAPHARPRRRRGCQAIGLDHGRGTRRSHRSRRLDYLLTISESSEFSQKFLIEQGDENRYMESTSALKTRIVGNLALVFSVRDQEQLRRTRRHRGDGSVHGAVDRVRLLKPKPADRAARAVCGTRAAASATAAS